MQRQSTRYQYLIMYQHYVSKFILRRFLTGDNCIHVSRPTGDIILANEYTASEYITAPSYDPAFIEERRVGRRKVHIFGKEDNHEHVLVQKNTVEFSLGLAETHAAPIIAKMLLSLQCPTSSPELGALNTFLNYQFWRSLRMQRLSEQATNKLFPKKLAYIQNPSQWSYVLGIEKKAFPTNSLFLEKRIFRLCKAPQKTEFIIGDNPFVYHSLIEEKSFYLDSPYLEFAFPLSPHYALVLMPPAYTSFYKNKRYRRIMESQLNMSLYAHSIRNNTIYHMTTQHAALLNQLQIQNSSTGLIARKKETLHKSIANFNKQSTRSRGCFS